MERLDLQRYSGLWYEFARTPLFWEVNCDTATAEYIPNRQGTSLEVINRCYDGKKQLIDTRRGTATLRNDKTLSLIFDDGRPANPYPAPYIVVETDYRSYSIVKGTKDAWILTRDEYPTQQLIKQVIAICDHHGLNIDEMTISREKARSVTQSTL